jgi:hypothetical protein
MKRVELVRQRVARGMVSELQRLRGWLSSEEGGTDAVQRLRDKDFDIVAAKCVETVLEHIGIETQVKADRSESHARRVVARMGG